jgi:hypothetical protein
MQVRWCSQALEDIRMKRKIQETGDFLPVKLHKMEIMWGRGGGEQAENEEEKSLVHFLEKMLGLFEQIK